MSLAPFARWRGPVPNKKPGAVIHPVHGFVLHVQVGYEAGTDAEFHNPAAQASADFGIDFDGTVDQWCDPTPPANEKAWAEAYYNPFWYSMEIAGFPDQPMTDPQLQSAAELVAWGHVQDGYAVQVTDDPNGFGLITHGDLGGLGGGHFDCPGAIRSAQRPEIVRRTLQLLGTPVTPPSVTFQGDFEMQIVGPAKMDFLPAAAGGVLGLDPRAGWEVHADGGIDAVYGAPFYGGYLNLPAETRNAPRVFFSVAPRRDGGVGYEIESGTDLAYYSFGPDVKLPGVTV